MNKDSFPADDNYEDGDQIVGDDEQEFFPSIAQSRQDIALEKIQQKESRERLEKLLEERRLRKELSDFDSYDLDD